MDQPLVITGPDARHLAVVRRAAPGEWVRVSDGRGRVIEARLDTVSATRVEATVVGDRRVETPRPEVQVYLGLAKGDKVDQVIRQLVELGVDAMTVFQAGRSVSRWDQARASSARFRWAVIAREAAKQSHRAWLPTVAGPLPSAAAASEAAAQLPATGLVAHPQAAMPVREALGQLDAGTDRVWLAVGPEGGLSPDEVASFGAAGGMAVTLGTQILRAQTAPVVLASLTLYQLGRFDG